MTNKQDELGAVIYDISSLADDLHDGTDFMDYVRGHETFKGHRGEDAIWHLNAGLFAEDDAVRKCAAETFFLLFKHHKVHGCFDTSVLRALRTGLRNLREQLAAESVHAVADAIRDAIGKGESVL